MRLLIDECLPRALKRLLRGHTCRTVQEMAWSGIKNGALLSLAEDQFDALITIDQGFELAVCRYRTFTNDGWSYAQPRAHPFACLRNSKTRLP